MGGLAQRRDVTGGNHCKKPNSRPPTGLTRTGTRAASRWNIADSPGAKTQYAGDAVAITGVTTAGRGVPDADHDQDPGDACQHGQREQAPHTQVTRRPNRNRPSRCARWAQNMPNRE